MADDNDLDLDNDAGDGTDDGANQTEPKMFTQEKLDQIVSRKKAQGVRQALKQLGFETIEEAQAAIDGKKKAVTDDEEATQRIREAEEATRKAEETRVKATVKSNTTDVILALTEAGMERAIAKRMAQTVDVDLLDDDLDESEIEDAVETFKKEMPQLFATKDEDEDDPKPTRRKAPDSTLRGKPPAKPKGANMRELGSRKFAERFPDLTKS